MGAAEEPGGQDGAAETALNPARIGVEVTRCPSRFRLNGMLADTRQSQFGNNLFRKLPNFRRDATQNALQIARRRLSGQLFWSPILEPMIAPT